MAKVRRFILIVSIVAGVLPSVGIMVAVSRKVGRTGHSFFDTLGQVEVFRWTFWMWTIGAIHALRQALHRVTQRGDRAARLAYFVAVLASFVVPVILVLTKAYAAEAMLGRHCRETLGATGRIKYEVCTAVSGVFDAYRETYVVATGSLSVQDAFDSFMTIPAVMSFCALVLVCRAQTASALAALFIAPLLIAQFYPSLAPVPDWTTELVSGELVAVGVFLFAERTEA